MSETPDNIVELADAKKNIGEDILRRGYRDCQHGSYLYYPGEDLLDCRKCKAKIPAINVIEELSQQESRYRYALEQAQKKLKAVEEKCRTKCEYCGHMTRVKT